MPLEPQDYDELRRLKEEIVAARGLWQFMGNAEKEVLCAQTISATVVNLDEHGEPFSIRGPNVVKGRQVCGTDNFGAYKYLKDEGYFEEDTRLIKGKDMVVIFPTKKLLTKISGHFAK